MSDPDEQPVQLRFESDLTAAHWEISGLQLCERFNEPYELRIEIRSDDLTADPLAMLGGSATVIVERGVLHREFSGIIESVEDGVHDQQHVLATLVIVPALLALRQRRNSRIFSEMTIPDILTEVLEAGLGGYQRSADLDNLSGDYPPQEYTVQYQETDLDFVHRLMEEYGIGYCFRHEGGAETMVLFDDSSVYANVVSHGNLDGELRLVLGDGGSSTQEDVRSFSRMSELRPTVARTMVFDWLGPAELSSVENSEATDLGGVNGATLEPEREIYEHVEPSTLSGYRSEGLDMDVVDKQTMLQRKRQQRDAMRFAGMTTVTGLSPGVKFELFDHPQSDLCRQYLVVAVDHAAGDFANPDDPDEAYTNRVECIPLEVEWRPDRRTPRPRMPSMQTATVVGPAGEEIHTDEHGRIKVQFHWDRRKLYNDEASCFIRVVQPWAGNGWGFVFLPRIGMEVAVSFVDGDPDRPVVTGCLYNGDHRPPYTLPDEKTKSTIKSDSSPGGGGFNELRFEDAAGSEEIFLHAQKDLNEVILNDMSTSVGHDQSLSVGHDQSTSVDNDQSLSVGNDRSKDITGNETINVHKDRVTTIDGTETMKILGSHNLIISGGACKGSGTDPASPGSGVNVTGEYNIVASQKFTVTVGASKLIMDTSSIRLETSANITLNVGGSTVTLVPAQVSATSATVVVTGGSGGASVLTLNADADLKGGGKVKAHKGGSEMTLDGTALLKGSTATVEGTGQAELKGAPAKVTGGVVDINGAPVNVTGSMINLNA